MSGSRVDDTVVGAPWGQTKQHNGKSAHLLPSGEFDMQIDTAHGCLLNMKGWLGNG